MTTTRTMAAMNRSMNGSRSFTNSSNCRADRFSRALAISTSTFSKLFDSSFIDDILEVDYRLAYTRALDLCQTEGLLAGPSSGLIYEKPPQLPLQGELYAALVTLHDEIKKQQADRAASGSFKDTEVFCLLVFLYRMGLLRTNGRPRARLFIEFLRGQFPQAPELKREESRIIVP